MTYFVMAHKRDGVLENVKIGGFKNMAKAYDRFRKYATSEIKIYTASGLKTIAVRINNQEVL
jgi:hypothetical protein